MNINKLSGIYPVSPSYLDTDDEYLHKCFEVISSGISIFQFRSPYFSSRKKRFLLNKIYSYCNEFDVQLIINNDYKLIKHYDGSGIHLGRGDMPLEKIKNFCGSDVLVGYSCGSEIFDIEKLIRNNISYFSIGAFSTSNTKKNTNSLSRFIIEKYKVINRPPMCIIGGINLDNIKSVLVHKPEMVAISEGIFRQELDNIKLTINELMGLMREKEQIKSTF